jgi:FAD:protein FMN transferase
MAFAAFSPLMPSLLRAASVERSRVRRARPLLGTIVEIEVGAERSTADLHAAIDAAFAVIEQVHDLMSYQDTRSELSRLNRTASGEWQRVDTRTFAVIEAALRFAELSEGAFDPCVQDKHATWRDVALNGRALVRYSRPLRLDLSGIAKGFAVDQAVATLQQLGMDEILVNAGGDLRITGHHERVIMLRDPAAPTRTGHELCVQDAALATSATYFSPALIDGRTRATYSGGNSVSVRADSCMSADALTKVVLFAEPAVAEQCLQRCNARAYLLGAQG